VSRFTHFGHRRSCDHARIKCFALIADFAVPTGTRRISKWCGREDSNFHGLSPTTTSTLRVYQFRHDRTWNLTGNCSPAPGEAPPLAKGFAVRNGRS